MSSEERIIRPYQGVDRIGRVLADSFVQMTPQHRIEPDSTKRIVASEYVAFPVQLWLAADEAGMAGLVDELALGLDEAGLAAVHVEVVVVLSTPRLKLAEIVWRKRADELAGESPHIDIAGDPRRAPLRTPFGGCRIDVYVLLSKHLPEAPLRPWRKGTWLARARFEIKTDLGDVGFTPLPLTKEDREHFGLPATTIRHAVVEDPFAEASGADTVKLYVDEELLSQLALQPSLASAKAFQRQLFVDAMGALIHTASRHSEIGEMTWGDVEPTVLGRLLERLAGPKSDKTAVEHRQRCEALLKDVEDQPELVVGWVEAVVPDLRSGLVELLRGESA